MESLEEKKKQLSQLLEQANRLHHKGELNKALKLYRQALGLANSKEKKDEIQVKIDDAHEMLAFVQGTDEPEKTKLSEVIKDWASANIFAIAGAAILALLVLLGILLTPAMKQVLNRPTQAAPVPEPTVAPDVIIRADNDAAGNEMQGTKEDSGEGNKRKDKISIVTLTVPDSIYEPYPSKYIIKGPAPVYEAANPAKAQSPSAQILLNTRVLLVAKTDNKQWLEIETAEKQRYWISAAYLGDSRFKSAAEIDAEIKTALGGKYWELQAEGQSAPFTYYLYINAPQAEAAYEALIEAYQFYASRQLIKMINTHSHSKTESIQVEAQKPQNLASQPNPIKVSIHLRSKSGLGSNKTLGQKTIEIPKLGSKRYELRTQLEGL